MLNTVLWRQDVRGKGQIPWHSPAEWMNYAFASDGNDANLKGAAFLAGFGSAISDSLDPHEVCLTAARWLQSLFGGHFKAIVYTDGIDDSVNLVTPEGVWTHPVTHVNCEAGAGGRWESCLGFHPDAAEDKSKAINLPEDLGAILFRPETRVPDHVSDFFMEHIAGRLAGSLRNALEHSRIKDLSLRDSLTGLFNRRVLETMLAMEFKKRDASPLSLLLIDIDNFKAVNDSHGHGMGDRAISRVAELLLQSFREYDVVVRYGGEEFAVLLPDTSTSTARRIAERFRETVERVTIPLGDTSFSLTVSVGVSTFALRQGRTEAELIESADLALYQAKASGKNRVCCHRCSTRQS